MIVTIFQMLSEIEQDFWNLGGRFPICNNIALTSTYDVNTYYPIFSRLEMKLVTQHYLCLLIFR